MLFTAFVWLELSFLRVSRAERWIRYEEYLFMPIYFANQYLVMFNNGCMTPYCKARLKIEWPALCLWTSLQEIDSEDTSGLSAWRLCGLTSSYHVPFPAIIS